jgi:hypothetical protein
MHLDRVPIGRDVQDQPGPRRAFPARIELRGGPTRSPFERIEERRLS